MAEDDLRQVDGTYVARMEDVLNLYAEAPDPSRPVSSHFLHANLCKLCLKMPWITMT
jgi:hypothetical protein